MIISHRTTVRVRYAHTDQMGYVYYGRYAEFYEVGRVELMRQLNLPYRELEEHGVFMPVAEMHIRYFRPALYDDLVTIETGIVEVPRGRMKFVSTLYNEAGELLNRGEVTLAFFDRVRRRPTRAPKILIEAIEGYLAS